MPGVQQFADSMPEWRSRIYFDVWTRSTSTHLLVGGPAREGTPAYSVSSGLADDVRNVHPVPDVVLVGLFCLDSSR